MALTHLLDMSVMTPLYADAVREAVRRRAERSELGRADLLVAAAAEAEGITVCHYDADFDRIADVTGQSTEWVVPRGSVD